MSVVRVNQIQDTSTNVAANISGGVVSLPSPLPISSGGTGHSALIAFDVSRVESSGDAGKTGVIVFNTITTNIGNAYNASNGRFTAPVAGTYEFSHTGMGAGDAGGGGVPSANSVVLFFRKNGSSSATTKYGRVNFYVQAVSYPTLAIRTILTLAQNDYIEVFYAGMLMYSDVEIYNNFSGHLIGA